MSVYTSTNTLHDKTGYPYRLPKRKRSSIKQNTQKIEALFNPDAIDIYNRSGKAIMNSPPVKITGNAILHSSIVRHCATTEEHIIWRYLLRPGRFFFILLCLGLLATLSAVM